MKAIAVSFSLKNQSLPAILEALKEIAEQTHEDGEVILIHGNLPRKEVLIRSLSTELVDALESLFPIQLNLWTKELGTMRPEMLNCVQKLHAEVFIIGRIDGDTKVEDEMYRNVGISPRYVSL